MLGQFLSTNPCCQTTRKGESGEGTAQFRRGGFHAAWLKVESDFHAAPAGFWQSSRRSCAVTVRAPPRRDVLPLQGKCPLRADGKDRRRAHHALAPGSAQGSSPPYSRLTSLPGTNKRESRARRDFLLFGRHPLHFSRSPLPYYLFYPMFAGGAYVPAVLVCDPRP